MSVIIFFSLIGLWIIYEWTKAWYVNGYVRGQVAERLWWTQREVPLDRNLMIEMSALEDAYLINEFHAAGLKLNQGE